MCCSLSKPVERRVNTDGAPFHTLLPDLANKRRVKEGTLALNPYALHRNLSPSAGERTDTSLPHNIMQKLDCFHFLLSHGTCYLLTCPCSQQLWDFLNIQMSFFNNSCSYFNISPYLFYTHHLLHCFTAALMMGISFF